MDNIFTEIATETDIPTARLRDVLKTRRPVSLAEKARAGRLAALDMLNARPDPAHAAFKSCRVARPIAELALAA